MSVVYWHSQHGTAELRGFEYAWLRRVSTWTARSVWGVDDYDRAAQLMQWVPERDGDHDTRHIHGLFRQAQAQQANNDRLWAVAKQTGQRWPDTAYGDIQAFNRGLESYLRVDGLPLIVGEVSTHTLDVELNTALRLSSSPIALAAKVRGYCHGHCFVDGPDRAWLADVIDLGLDGAVFRKGIWYKQHPDQTEQEWVDSGWEQVTQLLRSRDDGPVVLAHSSSGRFPNAEISTLWTPDLDEAEALQLYDCWDRLPPQEQWDRAMEGLRDTRPWSRLAPDTLSEVMFGAPVTVLDLFASDRDERIREAARKVAEFNESTDQSEELTV